MPAPSSSWTPRETAQPDAHSRRVGRFLLVAVSLALLALLGRVYQLQANPAPRIAGLMHSQTASADLAARRGALTDRRGRPLATTRTARRLFIDPALIQDHSRFSETVGYELGFNPADIERLLYQRRDSRYAVIAQRLTDEQADRFTNLDLPGLYTEPVTVRDYPHGPLAGQLLGFVGKDGKGLAGLEQAFEPQLAGQPGQYSFLRDHRARRLWLDATDYQPHTDGQNVRLALDAHIQALTERALLDAVKKHHAAAGQAVVIDPHTGEVLALAHVPQFDPADFRTTPPEKRRLRVVTDSLEPGSTFKPFVWAGLTELGLVDPDESFDCEQGSWRMPNGRTLRDAFPKGDLTWAEVLRHSSNIGMAKAAARATPDQLHRIITAFGFGQPTDSDLPGEVTGLVRPPAQWSSYSMGSLPMGQEVGVTVMQMARAFCVIANDGQLVTPTLLARRPGQPIPTEEVLSPEVAALTRAALRRVVAEDTRKRVESDLYPIFGKSGTAQLPDLDRGGYHDDLYVSSFIAAAPLDKPRLVVAVYLHQTTKATGHFGSTVAGPVTRIVLEQSLQYLGVPPAAIDASAKEARMLGIQEENQNQ